MNYDVIVIGAGPGGYVAAVRAAQLGFKTACVEAAPTLGGTCLNVGCIPSKVLLETTGLYEQAQHDFAAHGIRIQGVTLDVGAMIARKDSIVKQLTDGIGQLFAGNRIDRIQGRGRLLPGRVVEVSAADGTTRTLQANTGVIIAVGSQPAAIAAAPTDGEYIVTSDEALSFTEVPARLCIIGAGVIGLEMGSVWRAAGAQTVILEAGETLLPAADRQLAQEALNIFRRQGLDIRLGAKVTRAAVENGAVHIRYQDGDGEHTLIADKLLVAVGRSPNTAGVIDESCNITTDARGFIEVDAHCRTGEAGVYAIGDCVRGPMLAHKSAEEGVMAAEILAGQAGEVRYDTIPSVIYTHPEMAWVGQTEAQLQNAGISYRKGDFPFAANGRAKAIGETAGFVKILTAAESDEILGAHIIGANASELIHELVLALEYYAAGEDIARTMHAHPTLAEAVHEAALATAGRAIHRINPPLKRT